MSDFYNFLFYDKQSGIVDKIDNTKFLGLNYPDTSRIDLYLYAMALGRGVGSKLGKKDSFVRSEYVKSKLEALPLISSLTLGNLEDDNLEDILDKNTIFNHADECANTGFRMIEDLIENSSVENLELILTADLDNIFDSLGLKSDE